MQINMEKKKKYLQHRVFSSFMELRESSQFMLNIYDQEYIATELDSTEDTRFQMVKEAILESHEENYQYYIHDLSDDSSDQE